MTFAHTLSITNMCVAITHSYVNKIYYLRPEAQLMLNNSVPILQNKHISIIETGQFMLSGETMAVHYEKHTKHINTLHGQTAEFHNLLYRVQELLRKSKNETTMRNCFQTICTRLTIFIRSFSFFTLHSYMRITSMIFLQPRILHLLCPFSTQSSSNTEYISFQLTGSTLYQTFCCDSVIYITHFT